MSDAHLLLLSAPEIVAAPGFRGVLFGPDGAFPSSPIWTGPLFSIRHQRWLHWTADGGDGWQICNRLGESGTTHYEHSDLALDLRTSAADRLAKLCARVCLRHIGVTDAPVSVYVFDDWERCGLEVSTSGTDRYRQRHFCWDGSDGGGNDHFIDGEKRELFHLPVEVVARPQSNPISFLSALTLFLAPEIAALKDAP